MAEFVFVMLLSEKCPLLAKNKFISSLNYGHCRIFAAIL